MEQAELAAIKAAPADTTFRDVLAVLAEVEQLRRQALIADEVENTLVDVNTRLETESAQLKERLERAALREGQALLELQFLQAKLAIATEALEHIAGKKTPGVAWVMADDALIQMSLVGETHG